MKRVQEVRKFIRIFVDPSTFVEVRRSMLEMGRPMGSNKGLIFFKKKSDTLVYKRFSVLG